MEPARHKALEDWRTPAQKGVMKEQKEEEVEKDIHKTEIRGRKRESHVGARAKMKKKNRPSLSLAAAQVLEDSFNRYLARWGSANKMQLAM